MYRGVDVSGYHGKIDWEKAKSAGVKFAVLKVIRKDLMPDKQFENNWRGCLEAGVDVSGVYQYSYAFSIGKAVADAEQVLAILGERKLFVWLHWEAKCLPKGKEAAAIINAYGDVITSGGCEFGVCFGKTYKKEDRRNIIEYVRSQYRAGWKVWHPFTGNMKITDPVNLSGRQKNQMGTFRGWQYTKKGLVPGIEKMVSLNIWYEEKRSDNIVLIENNKCHLLGIVWENKNIWEFRNITDENIINYDKLYVI